MTFPEYITKALALHHSNPELRVGQSYFNTLYEIKPDMANLVRGTDRDPFYRNAIIPAFLDWVEQHWNEFS